MPVYVITRSIAETLATPRQIGLPGGTMVMTTMKDLHGAGMGGVVIGFVAALVGVFVMQSALEGDRRLVVAGYRPGEAVLARLVVVVAATALVVVVSAGVTAANFTPASWPPLIAALVLLGLIYAAIGALAGAVLDKLAATYLMLFLVMTDLGVVQSPMFHTTPGSWAWLLPGYGASRVMYDGGVLRELPGRRRPAAELRLARRPRHRGLRRPSPSGGEPIVTTAASTEPDRRGYSQDKDELIKRLNRIEGQVGGIGRMIESDRYCIDIVTQINAARAALDQVAPLLLEDHTRCCVMEAKGRRRPERVEELIAVVGRLLGRSR